MIEVRNKLVSLLHNHVEKPVIPNDTTGKRPDYPYIDYTITSSYNDSGEGNYSYDGDQYKVELQRQVTFSINSYSDNEAESYELAKEAWDYFKHHIERHELTIVNVESIGNRTMLKVDEYERRYGFDVFIRYSDTITKDQLYMEDITIIQE